MLFSFINGLGMIVLSKVPAFQSFFRMIETMPDVQGMAFVLHTTFLGSIIYSAIQLAIFFFGTERILSKRLNLE